MVESRDSVSVCVCVCVCVCVGVCSCVWWKIGTVCVCVCGGCVQLCTVEQQCECVEVNLFLRV